MDFITFNSRVITLMLAAMILGIAGCATAPAPGPTQESYAFWPPFPDEPRIQFLASYRYSSDVRPPRSGFDELVFGKEQRVLPINMPYGVAMWDGRIYICDIRNASLLSLDIRNQQVRVLGTTGTVRFVRPTDVAVTPDGMKYVTDMQRGAVLVFDADDRNVNALALRGTRPTGIAAFGDELFIGDFESQQVIVINRHTGEELRRIGERGDDDGQFVWPLGVDVDREGNLYVADALKCRIQKFDRDGTLVRAWGQTGDALGDFVRPKLLSVDSEGIVYVVDAAFQNVQMFDGTSDESTLLMFFGGAGPHPGAMLLPVGVSVHEGDLDLFADRIHPAFKAERLVLVTNQFGPNRVSVYALGRLREGRTAQDTVRSAAKVYHDHETESDVFGLSDSQLLEMNLESPPSDPVDSDAPLPDDVPAHMIKPIPKSEGS